MAIQGRGAGGRGAASGTNAQQMVPVAGGGQPSLLDLFNTPHGYGGGGGGASGITNQMKRLKM